MRTDPLPSLDQIPVAHATAHGCDIQLLVHAAWLLAGMAIALAGCSVSDEADLHTQAPNAGQNIAHAPPQPGATSGNVEDLTY
ncbi:MAG TPA: hypothetical protein VFJ62_08435 [Usitatibacter sp.]|nr:hypothetical protein [Usitatibacter sp.]